jgi:hypothetical protein
MLLHHIIPVRRVDGVRVRPADDAGSHDARDDAAPQLVRKPEKAAEPGPEEGQGLQGYRAVVRWQSQVWNGRRQNGL